MRCRPHEWKDAHLSSSYLYQFPVLAFSAIAEAFIGIHNIEFIAKEQTVCLKHEYHQVENVDRYKRFQISPQKVFYLFKLIKFAKLLHTCTNHDQN